MKHLALISASSLFLCGTLAARATGSAARRELRVCADPNNLPLSNARLEGFENRIAAIVAKALDADLSYTFWPQRRGFARYTVRAGRCDVVLGVPRESEQFETTNPYYRSTYAFVYRKTHRVRPRSWDDPRFGQLRIGVQMVGDDYANTPPVHALAASGFGANLIGFTVYGDYAADVPGRAILDAVSRGDVDVAIVWGPLAGYAVTHDTTLALALVPETNDGTTRMTFEIAMGVEKGNHDLTSALNEALRLQEPRIKAVLRAYRVPLAPEPSR
jgi:mxaJ protein